LLRKELGQKNRGIVQSPIPLRFDGQNDINL